MDEVIRIRRRIESDTLRIPEIRQLIGCDVEILVRKATTSSAPARTWESLKGSVVRYDHPFEPVAEGDWEVLQ